jgi:dynein intermediate chain
MQQRRDEILAKKAKLAELKRQRELRAREVSASRQSIGSAADVGVGNLRLYSQNADMI